MADRQLFQLTARNPALTDVFGNQDAAGVAEQGKSTIQQLKELLQGGKKFTIRFSMISDVFSNQLIMPGGDFPGLTITTSKATVDTITITLSQAVLNDATKTNFQLNTNGTLFVRPAILSPTRLDLICAEHDGTPPPSPMTTFTNFFITVFIYP